MVQLDVMIKIILMIHTFMKTADMLEYAQYSSDRLQELSDKHISSEVHLYEFIHEKKGNMKYLIIRYRS